MIRLTPVVVALFLTLFNGCDPLCDKCLPPLCFEPGDKSVFPLEVGNWWVYRVFKPDTGMPLDPPNKVLVVETQTGPGAFRHSVEGYNPGVNWVLDTGKAVEWTRRVKVDADSDWTVNNDSRYDPPSVRIDYSPEHTCAGDSWTESYDNVKVGPDGEERERTATAARWSVPAVPARVRNRYGLGTFEALCARREALTGDPALSTGNYCFVPGIGKVYEASDQVEILESYCTDGPSCCERTPAPGAPRTLCPDGCFDLARDVEHCGRCDRACATGEVCRAGECVR